MKEKNVFQLVVLGSAAGFVGTMVLLGLRAASQKAAPSTMPTMWEEPGQFMTRKLEQQLPQQVRERVPDRAENALAGGLGLGYGLTAGALYGVARPSSANTLLEGTALGIATWAAGYLGWLPALRLLPPVNKQQVPQVVGPVIRHIVFGVATVAAYDSLADPWSTD